MVNQPVKKQSDFNLFLNNYFNIILAVVLILFFLVAYFIILGPKFSATQAAITANLEEKQLLYEMTQNKLANLKIISEIYQKISPADLQKFNSVLPDSYVRERLFGELEEVIGRGGWLISEITIVTDENSEAAPLASTLNKKLGVVNLQFSLAAIDYQGFKNLLRLLENNLRLFDVTSVDFSPTSKTATIVLSTYYY